MPRMSIPENIKRLRKAKRLSQPQLAKAAGVSQQLISQLENGINLTTKFLPDIAKALGATMGEIDKAYVPSALSRHRQVRLAGFVGAGQEVYQFDEDGAGWVDAPPNVTDATEAVEVQGSSMLPVYKAGAILYYSMQMPPDEMIGEQCVLKLEDDRVLVKTLTRGRERGLYTLVSFNADPIEDVGVVWAAPIDWIKPRR